jgi:hypothetical protein
MSFAGRMAKVLGGSDAHSSQVLGTVETKTVADLTTKNIGASSAATVTALERGSAQVHQTVLTLAAFPITVVDANVGGGAQIYDFPEGRILVLGALASLAFTTTSVLASTLNASKTINYGVGTVVTASQASGTLATTEQNIVPTTNATSSATINVAGAAANGALAAAAQFDGTSTAVDAYLNVGVAGATDIDGDATVTVDGTIIITWVWLGDY